MNKQETEKYQAIRSELEKLIIKKLDSIKERVLTSSKGTINENIQILTLVSDELDDVLLNWETSELDIPLYFRGGVNFEEDDDDDDY